MPGGLLKNNGRGAIVLAAVLCVTEFFTMFATINTAYPPSMDNYEPQSSPYRPLLEQCFEIEGLLTLLLYRQAETPAEVESLLRQKVASLAEAFGQPLAPAPAPADEPADEPAAEADPEADTEDPERLEERLARAASGDLRAAFSLNDRYRYRRELFGNSEAAMLEAFDCLQACPSLAEAEGYVYDALGWDPEAEDVRDFMLTVRHHFNAR